MSRRSVEDVEGDIVALEAMDSRALRQRWNEVYGTDAPPKIQSGLLRLAVAYRIQEKAFGGLKPAAKRRMRTHLESRASRTSDEVPPKRPVSVRLARGSQLMREWNGVVHLVDVLDDGFRWKDGTYRTLSAVAVAITGTKWSGPRFFGLNPETPKQKPAKPVITR